MEHTASNERVAITAEHVNILRNKYKECDGMSDEQIINALHLYESRSVILDFLCYPTFDCCLRRIKTK